MAEKKSENGKKSENAQKYPNFCESCTHSGTKKCESCEDGYDGIPSEYKFDLSAKTPEELRREVLEQAIHCVCEDRKSQYGGPEKSFACIADLWNGYLRPVYPDITITPGQAAVMMILFKAAREATAEVHKIDSYVDMAGYAACAGGMIE